MFTFHLQKRVLILFGFRSIFIFLPLSTVCEEREFNFLAVRLMLDVLSKYSYSLYIGTLQVRHWSVAYYRWQFPIWRERFKYQLTGPSLQNKLAYQGKSLLWRGSVTCLFHTKKANGCSLVS